MAQRATGSASAKLTPSRYETWVEDVVEHYRLRAGDLLRFLRTKFGNYDERYFNIRRGDDGYKFFAPHELTEDEKDDELEDYRWKNPVVKK